MDGDGPVFEMVALERTLFVEGQSRDRKVGEFQGVVLALGWWSKAEQPARRTRGETPPPAVMYLVSDRGKPAPVWVGAAEIIEQDWLAVSSFDGIGDVQHEQQATE